MATSKNSTPGSVGCRTRTFPPKRVIGCRLETAAVACRTHRDSRSRGC